MIRSLSQYLLFALFLWLPALASAQVDAALPDSLGIDSSSVRALDLDPGIHEELASSEAYDYKIEAQDPETFWQRFKRWLIELIRSITAVPWVKTALKIFFYIVFGLVFIALIYQVLGGEIQSAFIGKNSNKDLSVSRGIEDIQSADLQKELDQAISAGNYALAVRYLYLMAIRDLDQKNLLDWKKDKTNHDYLRELSGTATYAPFDRLTYYYDYIEYGEFPVGKESFERVQSIYSEIREGIQS